MKEKIKISRTVFIISSLVFVLIAIFFISPSLFGRFAIPFSAGFGLISPFILLSMLVSGILWMRYHIKSKKGDVQIVNDQNPPSVVTKRKFVAFLTAINILVLLVVVLSSKPNDSGGIGILLLLPPVWIILIGYPIYYIHQLIGYISLATKNKELTAWQEFKSFLLVLVKDIAITFAVLFAWGIISRLGK